MNKEMISKMIDHTILKADASNDEIINLCNEAKENNFASVCINPFHIKKAYEILKDTDVKVCTVIGFPLGANSTDVKCFETTSAIKDGATEVDMVINIGAVKFGDYALVESDVQAVVDTAKAIDKNVVVKVIIETCLLNQEQKEKVITLLLNTGADFVKTSTGFSTGGATIEDVALMKSIVGDKMLVKASGGVKDFETLLKMKDAGASRIGTSNGIAIVAGVK